MQVILLVSDNLDIMLTILVVFMEKKIVYFFALCDCNKVTTLRIKNETQEFYYRCKNCNKKQSKRFIKVK